MGQWDVSSPCQLGAAHYASMLGEIITWHPGGGAYSQSKQVLGAPSPPSLPFLPRGSLAPATESPNFSSPFPSLGQSPWMKEAKTVR